MSLKYQTKDGDTIDYIAWKHYGTPNQLVTEQLLRANKGLSRASSILPAGMMVVLPEIDTTEKTKGKKLWD